MPVAAVRVSPSECAAYMSRPTVTRRVRTTEQRRAKWVAQGSRLEALLAERGIGKTRFAALLHTEYHKIHRWCLGFGFAREQQKRCAQALEVAEDAFEAPDESERRELEGARVLKRFLREPIAGALSPEDWRVLKSIRFHDAALRPSVAFYTAVAFALKGAIRVDEVAAVAAENAELDRQLAHKAPLRRR